MDDGVENRVDDLMKSRDEEESSGGVAGEESNNTGVIKTFISALISTVKDDEDEEEEKGQGDWENDAEGTGGGALGEETGGSGGGGGGGIVDNNLISNFSNQSEASSGDKGEDAKQSISGENEQTNADHGGSGSSVLATIVSHLPKPMSDGVTPTTEEASILIHSVVHD
ncbi:unnamed protein product [Cuscuta campestris]|uniref:Uncharacterized protein n=1 Tax=Cuscuta campestris TaxID=132261 RepID=A0A484MT09_9ASTE|nr:unnamed protein product [Cuscuta campestris]